MSTLASPPKMAPMAAPADPLFGITMLDGGLGAVPGSAGQGVLPRADVFCWCACMVCYLPPDVRPEDAPTVL
jgi:hypothetical protein